MIGTLVIFNSQGRLSTKIGATERIGDYLVPRAVTWTVTGAHGAPSLRMTFAVRQGRPECVDSQLVAGKEGRGLRSADLAGLNGDELTTGVFQEVAEPLIAEQGHETTAIVGAPMGVRESWTVRAFVEDRVQTPPGRSRAELEAVASVYHRNPASPVRAVEQLLGCARRTAMRRAAEAKEPGRLDDPPCSPESTAPKPSRAQVRAALRQRGHDVPAWKNA